MTAIADAPPPPPAVRARWIWASVLAVVILAVVIFVLLFQWNWLRGPLARAISGRIHRPVAITGNLVVHPWSWSPTATVNGLVIGNPAWAGPAPMAKLPSLTVQMKILPFIFRGKMILPLVEADSPRIALERDASGRVNWNFSQNPKAKPILPAIGHLVIRDGAVRYADARGRLNFAGVITSNETVSGASRGTFLLQGTGTLNGAAFRARVGGGPLINIDPNRPYDFTASLEGQETHLTVSGAVTHPFNLAGISGRFSVQGEDLADLYRLTSIALPNSPPYDLKAGFARNGKYYALRHMVGRVGQSDLTGSVSIDDSTGRPFVRADLASRLVRAADLVAVVGGAPKKGTPGALSPAEKIAAAKLQAEHRLLPDATLDASRIRGMDAKVFYKATMVEAGKVPIRDLRLGVTLDHSLLTINPLQMALSQGQLAGTIRIDARRKLQTNAIDLRLTNAQLVNLLPPKGGAPSIEGGVWARARLTGTGNSVRSAAATANGTVTLVMPGGKVRKTIADMLNLDLGRTAIALITKNKQDTPVRCGVADFRARNGVLTADEMMLDTGLVQVRGSGDIDLRNETVNLRLQGKPKKITLVRLDAPITVTGMLASPKIGVDIIKAAPQAVLAVALGVFAAPLAAILPFVAPGLAKNADCAALESGASQQGVTPPARR